MLQCYHWLMVANDMYCFSRRDKLNRRDNVTIDVLVKICKALECSFDDIMEVVEDDE